MTDRLKIVLYSAQNDPYCLLLCEDHAAIRSPLPRLIKTLISTITSHEKNGCIVNPGSVAIDLVQQLAEVAPISLEPVTRPISATFTVHMRLQHGEFFLECSRSADGSTKDGNRLPIEEDDLDSLHAFQGAAQQLGMQIEGLQEQTLSLTSAPKLNA